jgi:ferredoxin-type protein NapH
MAKYPEFLKKKAMRQFPMAIVFLVVAVAGWFYPLLGFFIPLCMVLGIGIGLFRGRKWCDWYCPRGSFYDTLIKPVSARKKIPRLLKNMNFRLGVLLLLLAIMAWNLALRWPDPNGVGKFFVIMLTATTILGVILAVAFHQRSWCCICPVGTFINLIGKARKRLLVDSESCTECKVCYRACPIQIKPYAFKARGLQIVNDGDCLKCGTCIAACPDRALSFFHGALPHHKKKR